jgi:hypothetical protein
MKTIVLSALFVMLLVSAARADEGSLLPEVGQLIEAVTSTSTVTSTSVAWVTSPTTPIVVQNYDGRCECFHGAVLQDDDFWTGFVFYWVGVGAGAIPFVIANGLRRRRLRRRRGCAECGSNFHDTDDHLLAKHEVERLVQS